MAQRYCGWCGKALPAKTTKEATKGGRPRRFCKSSCRRSAWKAKEHVA